ncbi:hypothetical protein SDC9_200715 [bioreactor metagenome]|uniref:Uncharacterized protein n=1 Tax=bioreactor metagenome TaxID=1076179 RepID=A0A645IQ96_9ZZZZ
MIAPIREADALKRFFRARFALGDVQPLIDQRQLYVFLRRHFGEQIEVLEHKADLFIADARKLALGILLDILPVEHVFAAVGNVQATDDVHQR